MGNVKMEEDRGGSERVQMVQEEAPLQLPSVRLERGNPREKEIQPGRERQQADGVSDVDLDEAVAFQRH